MSPDPVAQAYAQHRAYVLDLAFRMLGGFSDAEDVVQEAFARLSRLAPEERDGIAELRGWLVVVVSRLCLDHVRSARVRREKPSDVSSDWREQPGAPDPADRVTLDDSVRLALGVVLERLTPAERTVFVLHDVFQYTFEAVGEIVGRSPAACRQLASRARKHVDQEAAPGRFAVDAGAEHRVAERFIAACNTGDLEALLHVLDERVAGDVEFGRGIPSPPPFVGREMVAPNLIRLFGTGPMAAQRSLVSLPANGRPGVVAFEQRQLLGVLLFDLTTDDTIEHIHAILDPDKLSFISTLLA